MWLIAYSIMIFIFSSCPEVGVEQYFYGQDKVIHFVIKIYLIFFALILSISYGIVNEFYQYFIPER